MCAFFSLSSAALLGLIGGLALTGYDWLSERIENISWRVFLFFAGVFVMVAELATSAGTFGLVMRFASLNSVSAYNRVLIWDHGSRSVAKHPWFGIAYAEWERPQWMSASMDHFWLLMAVRFGILPSVLVALATIAAVVLLMRASLTGNYVDRRFVRAIAITLAVFGFGIISVALWQSAHVWFFMLIGLAVSIAHTQMDSARTAPRGAGRAFPLASAGATLPPQLPPGAAS
jgi:O-antigen ligase